MLGTDRIEPDDAAADRHGGVVVIVVVIVIVPGWRHHERRPEPGAVVPTPSSTPHLADSHDLIGVRGALTISGYSTDGWYGRIFGGCGLFDPDKLIRDFTEREPHDLLHKEPTKIKVDNVNLTYEGLIYVHFRGRGPRRTRKSPGPASHTEEYEACRPAHAIPLWGALPDLR